MSILPRNSSDFSKSFYENPSNQINEIKQLEEKIKGLEWINDKDRQLLSKICDTVSSLNKTIAKEAEKGLKSNQNLINRVKTIYRNHKIQNLRSDLLKNLIKVEQHRLPLVERSYLLFEMAVNHLDVKDLKSNIPNIQTILSLENEIVESRIQQFNRPSSYHSCSRELKILRNKQIDKVVQKVNSENRGDLVNEKGFTATGGTLILELSFNDYHNKYLKQLLNNNSISPDLGIADDTEGNTPLMWAVANASNQNASDLIDKMTTSDIDRQDIYKYQNSALHLAAGKGYYNIDGDGNTLSVSNDQLVEAMIKKGCNINLQNLHGDTPLHLACLNRNPKIIKRLLDAGADITIENKEGKTPKDYLALNQNESYTRLGFALKRFREINDSKFAEETNQALSYF